jgi:glutathione S-transferase
MSVSITQTIHLPNPGLPSKIPTSSIQLVYFNIRARAEPARLLLAYAGVEYQDIRIEQPWLNMDNRDHWDNIKTEYAFEQLPVLYWNGEQIAQSLAVTRFNARQVGLAGKDNLEEAQVNEIIHAIEDVLQARINVLHETDEKRKAVVSETYKTLTLPNLLLQLENRLVSRGGQFFVGDALSWADIQAFYFCSELDSLEQMDTSPHLASLVMRVGLIPNITNWVQSRPV